MYIIPCIQLDVVALLTCLMVYVHKNPKQDLGFFSDRHFNRMLWMTVIILSLDILSWLMEGYLPGRGHFAHKVVLALYFLIQTMLPLELLKYCLSICEVQLSRLKQRLLRLPATVNALLLVVNLFRSFAYRIAENNSYERMFGYLIIIIWPLFYILSSIAACAVRSARAPHYEKETARRILTFILFIFASALLSAFLYGFSPWPMVALGLVYLYLNVHSKQTRELGLLAYKDALTGVRNATAYAFMMKELDAKIQAGDAAFSIVVADVDDLKAVNDRYGHNAGDQLLIHGAKLICDIFAHSPVHRIGGDEFAIILEGSDYADRDLLIKRISREMAYTTFPIAGREHYISIAFGIADYDSRVHRTCADVFKAADHSMYVDKIHRKRARR